VRPCCGAVVVSVMSGREERDERRRSRSRSRSRSPRRRRTEGREREEHTGACPWSQKLREHNPKAERAVAGAWDDGRGRGGGGRRGCVPHRAGGCGL